MLELRRHVVGLFLGVQLYLIEIMHSEFQQYWYWILIQIIFWHQLVS